MKNLPAHSPQTTIGPRRMAGVGMIEVLIAIVILAFGMLGIAALQATTLRNSQSSLERSQAVVQTYAILDAMRANVGVARAGGYNLGAMTCAVPAAGDLAATDLNEWITALHDSLGESSCGRIACGNAACKITVQWDDSRGNKGSSAQQFETETRL